MAKCVFEHCENEGGRLKFDFTANDTGQRFASTVFMCLECHAALRSMKGNTGKLPQCDIEFSTSHHTVNFGDVERIANVLSMRMTEVTDAEQ